MQATNIPLCPNERPQRPRNAAKQAKKQPVSVPSRQKTKARKTASKINGAKDVFDDPWASPDDMTFAEAMAGMTKIVAAKKVLGISSWAGGEPNQKYLDAVKEHLERIRELKDDP